MIRSLLGACVLLAALFPSALLGAPSDGIEERRRMMFEAVRADHEKQKGRETPGFYRAAALFKAGHIEEARAVTRVSLEKFAPSNRPKNRWITGGNSGFDVWPGIDCYILHQHQMDESLRRRFREIYCGAVFYRRLSTSNHKIMAAVTRYLATQVWGEDAFRPDPAYTGKDAEGWRFGADDPTGERYIRAMLAAEPGEYASRPYGCQNMLPLLTLAECARDPGIRSLALAQYERTLGQLAPAYLGGHLATFSPRSYPDALSQRPWGVAALAWYYFDGAVPDKFHTQWALRAAISDYIPPAWILEAGTQREKPYTFRSFNNGWCLNHFITPSHALFSRSAKAGGKPFSGQSYPCGVMWTDPDRCSHLWVTCPTADTPEMARGLHTHGVTRHAQELLCGNSLLFVFDIPDSHPHGYALAYVPGGWMAMDNQSTTRGRVLLHYRDVLISLTADRPFEWNPQAGIAAPATEPSPGDSEFRVRSRRCAVVVEAAHPSYFPAESAAQTLAAFGSAIESRTSLRFQETDGRSAAIYRNLAGRLMECRFDGDDFIDGRRVDYLAWPVHDSPWKKIPAQKR